MAGYSTPSWANGTSPAINAANLLALGQAVELAEHPFGTCSTTAATTAKTVSIDFSGTLSLFNGLTIRVQFTYSNTTTNPTLAVNGTTACPIRSASNTPYRMWQAGQVLTLTYNNSNWYVTSGGLQMESGTYTGTGQNGNAHPNSITTTFTPFIVFISSTTTAWSLQMANPAKYGITFSNMNGGSQTVYTNSVVVSWGTSDVAWYSNNSAVGQLNNISEVYGYTIIGR